MTEGRKAPSLLPLHQSSFPIRFLDFPLSILEVSTAYYDVTILLYNSTNFQTFFFLHERNNHGFSKCLRYLQARFYSPRNLGDSIILLSSLKKARKGHSIASHPLPPPSLGVPRHERAREQCTREHNIREQSFHYEIFIIATRNCHLSAYCTRVHAYIHYIQYIHSSSSTDTYPSIYLQHSSTSYYRSHDYTIELIYHIAIIHTYLPSHTRTNPGSNYIDSC